MLKKTWILFLGLVVCIGSACVTPTHASSAPSQQVVLVHVKAASSANAKDEMVAIYNNTASPVDISNWCLKNKSNVEFICFIPYKSSIAYHLAPYTYVIIASESFFDTSSVYPEDISFVYTVTNQSSGSIVNSGDTISIVDKNKVLVDSYSWSTQIPAGKVASRNKSLTVQNTYETSNLLVNWFFEILPELPLSSIEVVDMPEPPIPTDPQNPDDTTNPPGTPPQLEHQLRIVELLANPIGSDAGTEYIEIYNPNDVAISLEAYRLRVGPQLEKTYKFPVGAIIQPHEYKVFTNQDIKYTLVNSVSAVQLERDGVLVDDIVAYAAPPEGFAYAESYGSWYYTGTPTPGLANIITDALVVSDKDDLNELALVSTLKPCAANQYRHPDTNRCRNIVTATTTPAPCASNQYRSPETNRCRNIATVTGPSPCKEGQERNPDTNRCRNIVTMTKTNHGIKDISIEESATGASWYWWLAIGGVVILILAYAVWEWREDLHKLVRITKAKITRNKK